MRCSRRCVVVGSDTERQPELVHAAVPLSSELRSAVRLNSAVRPRNRRRWTEAVAAVRSARQAAAGREYCGGSPYALTDHPGRPPPRRGSCSASRQSSAQPLQAAACRPSYKNAECPRRSVSRRSGNISYFRNGLIRQKAPWIYEPNISIEMLIRRLRHRYGLKS